MSYVSIPVGSAFFPLFTVRRKKTWTIFFLVLRPSLWMPLGQWVKPESFLDALLLTEHIALLPRSFLYQETSAADFLSYSKESKMHKAKLVFITI